MARGGKPGCSGPGEDPVSAQLARISREFLGLHRVYRYHLKKVSDLSDRDVISVCHWYCVERRLTEEWEAFRAEREDLRVYEPPFPGP